MKNFIISLVPFILVLAFALRLSNSNPAEKLKKARANQKKILIINKSFEKGYKSEWQTKDESLNLSDVWSKSDFFIDNQTSKSLYLEEIRYVAMHNYDTENNYSPEIIEIKPGINYELPIMSYPYGISYILRKPPRTKDLYVEEEEYTVWYLHY